MGNAKGNKPPTQTEIKKLLNIIGRDYGELTPAMKNTAKEILLKGVEYEPNRPSDKILSDIIMIYAYEMYGKGKLSKGNNSPYELDKGTMAEPESIRFLSRMDGIEYQKNEELFENKWFKGIPDVLVRSQNGKIEKIIEVKTSYDLPSFIMSMKKPEKQSNLFEVMGYMDLIGCKKAEIVHCLVDMPDKIAQFEEKRLRERYEFFQFEESVISDRLNKMLGNMEYSDIPDKLKIFRRQVDLNQLTMRAVKSRVTISRKWVKEIHELFTRNLKIDTDGTENYEESCI